MENISSSGAGKGEAFALLQEYLGIGQEETVYFGDSALVTTLFTLNPSMIVCYTYYVFIEQSLSEKAGLQIYRHPALCLTFSVPGKKKR